MYKIVVCNLGYNSFSISSLDGKIGNDFEILANEIFDNMPYSEDGKIKEIDGYKIISTNFTPSEEDFNNEGICYIVTTEDINRDIYITKI